MSTVVFCSTGSVYGYQLVYQPKPEDSMQVYIYRLANGITVYLTENHEVPRFYAEIAVRTGSQNDPPETTGLAHYFEHLMFKGSERLGTIDFTKEKELLDKIEELYEKYRQTTDTQKREEIYKEIDQISQEASKYAVPNELDRVYKSLGGDKINAHTWIDETVYKVELPSGCLEHWAMLESDRFSKPIFRLFATELETVYEEKNRAMDNREQMLMETINKALFPDHPYGTQTVLGEPEHLKNPSIKNIKNFFEKWYVPENLSIGISGDIKIPEAIEIIAKYFSEIRKEKTNEERSKEKPPIANREIEGNKICSPISTYCYEPLKERISVEIQFEGEPEVILAFRTVPKLHPDADKIALIDMILDNAVAGLINLNLTQKQKVRRAGSFIVQLNDLGVEYILGVPKDGQSLEDVEHLLLEQIKLLCEGNFEDWLLSAIITDFRKMKERSRETNEGRVSELTDAFIAHEDWQEHLKRIERMEKITKDEIISTAKKYFSQGYVAGYRKNGEREINYVPKPKLTPLTIDSTKLSPFAQQILSIPTTESKPVFLKKGKDYIHLPKKEGLDFWFCKNPLNKIFSFEIRVDIGNYHNPKIPVALRLLEKSGTRYLSAEDLKKEWYKLGAEFNVRSINNETVISLNGFDDRFKETMDLLMEVMFHPQVEKDVLEELKAIILTQREDSKKDPEEVMRALVQFNRLDTQSAYLNLLPEEDLKKLSVEELQDITKNLLNYKHHIFYAGTLNHKDITKLYKSYLKKELGQKEKTKKFSSLLKDTPPYIYLKSRKPENTQLYMLDKETTQANVRIEFGLEESTMEEEPVIEVFNSYFGGGMAGVVFQELREARALAYVAGAQYIGGYRKGDEDLMVGVIQTQPDKLKDALECFLHLFDNLPVSEERFRFAKESVLNDYQTDKVPFRSILGRVYGWYLHGFEDDPRKQWYAGIQKLTLQDLIQFHDKKVKSSKRLISVMLPLNRITPDSLAQFGNLRYVTLNDIFIK
ncbi:MAG: insulinase family protein [Candidatus Hydrogenedens sp.]